MQLKPLNAVLILLLFVLSRPHTVSAQVADSIGGIFESKQERYKREQEEQRQAELERRRLEDSLAQQRAELQALEQERRRLEAKPPASGSAAATQVYVVSDCAPCLKTLGFLDALNIHYEVLEVDTSHSVEQLYLQRFGRGAVPVVETRAGVVRGYRPAEIRRLYEKPQPSLPAAQRETPPAPKHTQGGAGTAPSEDQFDVSSSLERENGTPASNESGQQ